MKKFFLAILLSTALSPIAAGPAPAAEIEPRLQALVQDAESWERIPVIVDLQNAINVKDAKRIWRRLKRKEFVAMLKTQGDEIDLTWRDYIRFYGGSNFKNLWVRGAFAAQVPPSFVETLAQLPSVASVRYDATLLGPTVDLAASAATPEWNIDAVGAPAVWADGVDGQGAVVAIVDTGVDINHADLGPRWRGGTNSWFDPHGETSAPADSNATGHGTGVAGIAVGGDATSTSIGVAPGAQWIGVKLFDQAGLTQLSDIELSFAWLLDPDGNPNTDDAPDVVNNSWDITGQLDACDPLLQDNIAALRTAGIAVVFAAGNKAANEGLLANYTTTFSAGAVDQNLNVASWSARGPSHCDGGIFPDIVAPGVAVRTATQTYGGIWPTSFIVVDGTSFAAPHISGAVALLRSANPSLTVDEIETVLRQTAFDLGTTGGDNDSGFGLIDVKAAYDAVTGGPADPDADGDGYVASLDCNDADASVYPGAPEVAFDGVDQSCNGYDLTLDMVRADYLADKDKLVVIATSGYGDYSDPGLPDSGAVPTVTAVFADGSVKEFPMVWNSSHQRWQRSVGRFAARWGVPEWVRVSAPEGTIEAYLGDWPVPGLVNTLQITRSDYLANRDRLVVYVTTDYGDYSDPSLPVSGVRPILRVSFADGTSSDFNMSWSATNGRWQRSVTSVTATYGTPIAISVLAPEGEANLSLATADAQGLDNTLSVTQAAYRSDRDRLVVLATSAYGDYADVLSAAAEVFVTATMVDGSEKTFRMKWNVDQNRWQRAVGKFSERWGQPETIEVLAPEGSVSAAVVLL